MLTATDCIKIELQNILKQQYECIDEYGNVIPAMRYKYQELINLALECKNGLDWLEDRKKGII
jgi:hypothetical protein